MIISLVNQKGGVGKTTIAINMTSRLSQSKQKFLLIDADPQGSVLQWQSVKGNTRFDVLHHPGATFHRDIKELAHGYNHVVIDAPPAIGQITRSVLIVSHLAIVPICPSPLDIWSGTEIISLIQEAKQHNPKLRARLLISKKIPTTRIGREAKQALETYKIPIFRTEICQRIAYVEAMIAGLSVLEYAADSEAATEIKELCSELAK